jgi:hypothetical protein
LNNPHGGPCFNPQIFRVLDLKLKIANGDGGGLHV